MNLSWRSQNPIAIGAEASSVFSWAYDCSADSKSDALSIASAARRATSWANSRSVGPNRQARLAGTERDRAEQPSARLERDDDVRDRVERVVQGEMLLVDSRMDERVLARVLDQERRPAAKDLAHGMSLVELRRVAAAQIAQQLLPLRVPVRDHDLAQVPVALVDCVDDQVVGDARHQQPREVRERRLVVERGGEERAHLAEEVEALAREAFLGHVVEDVDHELDLALVADDRRRPDDRPARRAARQDAIAEDCLVRLPVRHRLAARQFVARQRRPVLAHDREPLEQGRPGQPHELLARLEPAQASRGVVRVDERAVWPLDRDPVADVGEDRGELVRRERVHAHAPQGTERSSRTSTAPDVRVRTPALLALMEFPLAAMQASR